MLPRKTYRFKKAKYDNAADITFTLSERSKELLKQGKGKRNKHEYGQGDVIY